MPAAHRRPSRVAQRPPLPADLVTVPSAVATGWTPAMQRHAIHVGDVQRVRRGVIGMPSEGDADLPDRRRREVAHLRLAQAAALLCERAVLSHACAAIALGIPTFGDLSRPCLTVPAGTPLRTLAGVHLHRATLADGEVRHAGGHRVTSPGRTVMDVAREHGVAAGVIAADYALHNRLVTEGQLADAFDACARWPGRKAARITLLSADAAAESVLESLSRLRLAALGLPHPRLQTPICDETGFFLGRCDFYWDDFGVVGEADGNHKYDGGASAIIRERGRQQSLEGTGLIVVRWGWSDLWDFGPVAARLRTAFERGARRGWPTRRWAIPPDLSLPLPPPSALTVRRRAR